MSRPWLTPARARELAAEAEHLAERVDLARAERDADVTWLVLRRGAPTAATTSQTAV